MGGLRQACPSAGAQSAAPTRAPPAGDASPGASGRLARAMRNRGTRGRPAGGLPLEAQSGPDPIGLAARVHRHVAISVLLQLRRGLMRVRAGRAGAIDHDRLILVGDHRGDAVDFGRRQHACGRQVAAVVVLAVERFEDDGGRPAQQRLAERGARDLIHGHGFLLLFATGMIALAKIARSMYLQMQIYVIGGLTSMERESDAAVRAWSHLLGAQALALRAIEKRLTAAGP